MGANSTSAFTQLLCRCVSLRISRSTTQLPSKMGFKINNRCFMRCCALLLFACQVTRCPECGVVHPYVSCVPSHLNMCTCWCKNVSCVAVLRGAGHTGAVFAMLSPTSCHNHRQHTAAHCNSTTLPLSRIFQLPGTKFSLWTR